MNRTPQRGCRRARGFTLLELLVAMSMFGLLLLLVFGALRTGARTTEAADRRLARFESVMQAEQLIVRLVRQASPFGGSGRGTGGLETVGAGSSAVFAGGPARLILVGPGMASFARQGLFRYEFFAAPSEKGGGLQDVWVHIDPFRPDMEEGPASEPRLLVEGVETFDLGYFGVVPGSDEGVWAAEWPLELEAMPALVSLHLRLAGAPERPPVVVRPSARPAP